MTAKVYYAHVMALYDTPQEARDLALLKRLGYAVLNPNQQKHQDGCKKAGMDYFRGLVESCEVLAFRGLPDGRISSGVALEIDWAEQFGIPVIELPSGTKRRRLSLAETREYLSEVGQR